MRKMPQKSATRRPSKGKSRNELPPGTFTAGGAALGAATGLFTSGPIGAKVGAAIGGGLGTALATITGVGGYKIRSNSLLSSAMVKNRSHHPDAHIIRKREYLGDLISSPVAGQFQSQSFPLNPGLENTFPWLSQLAANYEEYAFEGLVFEFRSLSADALNSVNTALGSVVMATNYSAGNPPFATKAEMEEYVYADSVKPSTSVWHFIECDPSQNVLGELYVRAGTVPVGQDPRFFDLGTFQIGSSGLQGTSVVLGEIWVTYQVALMKPKLVSALGKTNSYFHFDSTDTVSSVNPFGATRNIVSSNVACTITPTTIQLPTSPLLQTYRVLTAWVGTVNAAITHAVVTPSGGAHQVNVSAVTSVFFAPQNATSCNRMQSEFFFTVDPNSVAPLLTYSGLTPPSGVVSVDCIIEQIPNGIY